MKSVRKPNYNKQGNINCEVYHNEFGWIPYTATADDVELQGRVIYEAIMAGNCGEIAEYVEPEKTEAELIAEAEDQAAEYIVRIDAVATNNILWAQLTEDQQAELTTLRSELVSISDQDGYLSDIEWPDMPDYI